MISPKGRKSREGMVKSFKGIIGTKVSSEAFADATDKLSTMFQQNAVTNTDLVKVFGSGEDFLTRYASFEQKYFDALSTKMNTSKGGREIAMFHRKRGIINLNLLEREAQEELSTLFKRDVMRVEPLMRQTGLPSIELPSANLYRSAFKFNVDNSQGITHPAQILLNRYIFNFNPEKKGMESISLGGRNMFSSKSLKEMMNFFESNAGDFKAQMNPFGAMKAGEKVFTFDVETTGIAANSQVRSFAGLEMEMGANGQLSIIKSDIPNRGFAATEYNGMRIKDLNGATQSFNDFILKREIPEAQRRVMGVGGENFLDEASDFIEKMLQADRIAGHNAHFDVTMMTSTMMNQAGFSQHERAGKVIGQLYDRIDKGNYLVDTLESTRMYLQEKARVLSEEVVGTVDEQSQAFIKALMAPETRAKIAIGGSSSYADVGNIALNTNLFELIEKEGQAQTLFDQIGRGSHVAETDTRLQSYIGKYVASGELEIVTDIGKRSKFGVFARNVIAKSSAVTGTTNIADVSHLNETVFNYIYENTAGTTVRATAGEIGLTNTAADLEGILSYSKDTGGYLFSAADEQFDVANSVARSHIQGILKRAKDIESTGGGTNDVMTFASGGSRTYLRNLENEKIISTGVSFGTNSRMLEIAGLSAGTGTSLSADALTQTLGMTYSELGRGISTKDQIRTVFGRRPIDSVFQHGIADYTEATSQKIAKAFGEIGDKYAGVLDMQSKAFSTDMANATADVGVNAYEAAMAAGVDSKLLAHTVNPRLLGEFGFSYFQSQKRLRMFDIGKETHIASSRIMVPQEILREAMSQVGLGDTKMKIGLSKAFDVGEDKAARINAVWHLGEQINKDEAKSLAEKLLDLTSDEDEIKKILTVSGGKIDTQMREDIAVAKIIKDSGDRGQTIENLTDMIMNRGIVVGYNEGEAARKITDVLNVTGKLTETDVDMTERAVIHESGLVGHFKAGPFVDEKAVLIAGKMAEYEAASEVGASGISKALEAQGEVANVIENSPRLKTKLGTVIAGAKTGTGENKALSFYMGHKGKIATGAGLVAGAFLGYYTYQQHRKNELYNETMDAQPTQRGTSVDQYNSSANSNAYTQMRYSDPLSTAGIVGNLDRMKIGHTQMGNNKYNHLYGG